MTFPAAWPPRRASGDGLSLVELLVSMLLGLILSGGIVSAYLAAKRNYYVNDQLARIQENGRYAMRLLSRELAMAGFFGGAAVIDGVSPVAVGRDCSDRDWALDGAQPLELVNDHTGRAAPVTLGLTLLTCLDGAAIAPNTDLLSVRRTAGQASLRRGVPLEHLTVSGASNWYLRVDRGHNPRWEKLSARDLRDPARAVASLSYWEASARIFFIRRYSDTGAAGDGIPTLCVKTLAGDQMTSRCLVEGVENMQLEFGIDTDGDGVPNRYKAAPDGGDMLHAVTARIHLLLRSIDAISGYEDEKTYRLGQTTRAARHDAHIRRVFSSTVRLRNWPRPAG